MSHMNELSYMYTYSSDTNESCLTWMSYFSSTCLIWRSPVSYRWVISHMYKTYLRWMHHISYMMISYMMISYMSQSFDSYIDSFIWALTHSYELWLIHILTHSYELWLIHIIHIALTHSYIHMMNESKVCVCIQLRHEWVMSHMDDLFLIWRSYVSCGWVMSHMPKTYLIWMNHVSYEWVMSYMKESCLSDQAKGKTERVLKCVAVCCSVLQCVAVCCGVLQCVAVCVYYVAVCVY